MGAQRKLHIGMSLAPTWLSGDGWRHPDSNIEGTFGSDFYVDIARRAEAAKLDFVFRPDSLFMNHQIMETTPGFGSMDATLVMATLARETSHIGLLTTISTTFMPPYVVARQVQSLHWLSKGRAGWNIVTALDGNENFGLTEMPSSDERYARAAEFTGVVRDLWKSFPGSALKRDRESGRFADTAAIHPIDHEGTFYRVKGPLNVPPFKMFPFRLFRLARHRQGATLRHPLPTPSFPRPRIWKRQSIFAAIFATVRNSMAESRTTSACSPVSASIWHQRGKKRMNCSPTRMREVIGLEKSHSSTK